MLRIWTSDLKVKVWSTIEIHYMPNDLTLYHRSTIGSSYLICELAHRLNMDIDRINLCLALLYILILRGALFTDLLYIIVHPDVRKCSIIF